MPYDFYGIKISYEGGFYWISYIPVPNPDQVPEQTLVLPLNTHSPIIDAYNAQVPDFKEYMLRGETLISIIGIRADTQFAH